VLTTSTPSRTPTLTALATSLALAVLGPAAACDICAIYTATELREGETGLRLGVAEQYSDFATELRDGQEVTLPAKEHMNSSVTQFLVGYGFTRRLGLQLTIPYVYRGFTRIHLHRLESGVEQGIGDMALLGNFLAYHAIGGNSLFRFSLLGGVKFPTGNSDLLAEELTPVALVTAATPSSGVATSGAPRRRGVPSRAATGILPLEGGLHGHDLTLGSGSFDGIVGGQVYWSWGRVFVAGAMQYAVRSTGSFDYRFANDLTWLGGPGWYALLTHAYSLGVQAVLSGETKGKDSQQGRSVDDTAMTALYVGPGVSFTWGASLGAELAVDLPVIQHNTSLQLVPDVRVRGGVTWRF
jgi:hypothetical protein